jgi:hypothetical protein
MVPIEKMFNFVANITSSSSSDIPEWKSQHTKIFGLLV